MKYLVSSLAAALLLSLPVAAKDQLSINGNFQRVNTSTSATNVPGMTFDMAIGNNKARVTLNGTNVSPNTNFHFVVGGVLQANFPGNVRRKANWFFQNFPGEKALPLDFDPRGQVLTISDDKTNLLTLTVGTASQSTNLSYHESTDLTAVGSAGTAEVSYDQTKSNLVTFSIALKGASSGTNDVFVDGQYRGSFLVSKGKGTFLLKSPYGANDRPLTFDPRGKVVDVLQGGVLQFTGILRARANGVTQCPPTASQATLLSTGRDADAAGFVRFVTTAQCVRQFKLSAYNLSAGAYELYVNGTNRASLTVASNDASGVAQITFSSVPDSGESLLSFDAEGKLIQLQQGTNVFFSGLGTPVALTACAATQTTVPLWNSALISSAQSDARYQITEDCGQSFRVSLSGVAVGAYELYVGGVFRGVINVTGSGTATSGNIQFFSPFGPSTVNPLVFVPTGQPIEIRQGGNLLLQRTFPGSATPTPSRPSGD